MDATIFRKTEAGRAALAARDPALDPRTRTVLILVNGELGLGALGERLGGPPDAALQRLLALGLVEPAPGRPPRPTPRVGTEAPAAPDGPVPARPEDRGLAHRAGQALGALGERARGWTTERRAEASSGLPATSPPLSPERQAWRDAAHRRALQELGAWYGPDAAGMAAPLRAAGDEAALHRALQRLGDSLSVIMGTPRAQALLARIRGEA